MIWRKSLRIVGRMLIITLLLTSAVLKLSKPGNYETPFKNTYSKTKTMFPFLGFLPPVEKVPTLLDVAKPLHEPHHSDGWSFGRVDCSVSAVWRSTWRVPVRWICDLNSNSNKWPRSNASTKISKCFKNFISNFK